MVYCAKEILEQVEQTKQPIWQLFRGWQAEATGLSESELDDKMREILQIMDQSSQQGLKKPIFSLSGMTGGFAHQVWSHQSQVSFSGDFILQAMARALSTSEVNASMGKIVAAPTAGASGILPAAFISAKDKLNLSLEQLLPGLYTAGVVGQIVAMTATISGADGGCQAECGTAAAMAAAGLVELMGGSAEACFEAASFSLIHVMGLVCDPIAGFVEFPCSLRNASGVVNAFISADLAMASVKSLVPFDEVVKAMYRVGKMLPEALRETAMGGIAASDTAKELEEIYLNHN